jgi:hypothetical protein
MVQELQHQTVPEEFFNLTQLAEVAVTIAGKLSTTDIHEIRGYISKSDKCDKAQMEGARILSHYNNSGSYESTKKKWKNHWENFKEQENSSVSPKTYAFLSSSCSVSSVSSDCDDDSTKSLLSYSHKVFDRKKQRSFKQSSTESEYEFHFECQRPPFGSDASQCTSSCDTELVKIDNDDDEVKDEKAGEDADAKTDDHMCPECGKKYSTSESLAAPSSCETS